MELVFLTLLILTLVLALLSGFPVAFSLPGSAIITIGLAALCGYLFAGDVDAYFVQDGPSQWLNAGVTNFRSLYWEVERDTLIAIPLFVFMGIMLQRSKIAEDLLVAMAQLFGPVPGGLGISVVFVGALLAATTGIVGATVIAMGLISLPAMLRNNYSKPLATGTICASGTLGQIIPPSIVLIILADQLASAADQASTARKAEYKEATGEFAMPAEFDVVSASAGDMFMGAFIPGMILVGIYMLYILVSAVLRPKTAPPVPYDGRYDRQFFATVLLALIPPLGLIFAVLGSILTGVATVNQAGAIGAIGAMIMAGYRLYGDRRGAYWPAILALLSLAVLAWVTSSYELNVKNVRSQRDADGILYATIAVIGLGAAILWSAWRTLRIDDTLRGVMIETAKTTSMVFIILIGAAMLTAAFRGFGGEELVKHALTGLPGGFWTQFIVVMIVIFLLGFFLDFIEIAVVVVPIVAPILLADPAANITAVWLGVMIGLNIQTSFLTPPFGFALFYLRGVAPRSVKTTDIYKGAAVFIVLQLFGLAVAGYFPSLVNYLPNRTYLTSDTAPPPANPRLQQCLEDSLFDYYAVNESSLRGLIDDARGADLSYLPDARRETLEQSFAGMLSTFERVEQVRAAEAAVAAAADDYRPLHIDTRRLQQLIRVTEDDLKDLSQRRSRLSRAAEPDQSAIDRVETRIAALEAERDALRASIADDWEDRRTAFSELQKAEKTARLQYRRAVDDAYEALAETRALIAETPRFAELRAPLQQLDGVIDAARDAAAAETTIETIEALESRFGDLTDNGGVKSLLSKARRALKGDQPDRASSADFAAEALSTFDQELAWRERAAQQLLPALERLDDDIRDSIGVRQQPRLPPALAEDIAVCQSHHQDVSLHF